MTPTRLLEHKFSVFLVFVLLGAEVCASMIQVTPNQNSFAPVTKNQASKKRARKSLPFTCNKYAKNESSALNSPQSCSEASKFDDYGPKCFQTPISYRVISMPSSRDQAFPVGKPSEIKIDTVPFPSLAFNGVLSYSYSCLNPEKDSFERMGSLDDELGGASSLNYIPIEQDDFDRKQSSTAPTSTMSPQQDRPVSVSVALAAQLQSMELFPIQKSCEESRIFYEPQNSEKTVFKSNFHFVSREVSKQHEVPRDDLLDALIEMENDRLDRSCSPTQLFSLIQYLFDDENAMKKKVFNLAKANYQKVFERLDAKEKQIKDHLDKHRNRSLTYLWEKLLKYNIMPDFTEVKDNNFTFEEALNFIDFLTKEERFQSYSYSEVLHDFLVHFYLPLQWDVQLLMAIEIGESCDNTRSRFSELTKLAADRHAALNGKQDELYILKMYFKFSSTKSNPEIAKNNGTFAYELFHADASKNVQIAITNLFENALANNYGSKVQIHIRRLFNYASKLLELLVASAVSEFTLKAVLNHLAPFIKFIDFSGLASIFLKVGEEIKHYSPTPVPTPDCKPQTPKGLLSTSQIEELPYDSDERSDALEAVHKHQKAIAKHAELEVAYKRYKHDKLRFENLIRQFDVVLSFSPELLSHFNISPEYLKKPLMRNTFFDYVFFGRVYLALRKGPSFDLQDFKNSLKTKPLIPSDVDKQTALLHFMLTFNNFLRWTDFLLDLQNSDVFATRNAIFQVIVKETGQTFEQLLQFTIKHSLVVVLEASLIFGKEELDQIDNKAEFIFRLLASMQRILTSEVLAILVSHIDCTFTDLEYKVSLQIDYYQEKLQDIEAELKQKSKLQESELIKRKQELETRRAPKAELQKHLKDVERALAEEQQSVTEKGFNKHPKLNIFSGAIQMWQSLIEIAYLVQLAEPCSSALYSFPLPYSALRDRPHLTSAANTIYLLQAARGISWRVWKIPFVGTAVSQGINEGFSLSEAFKCANILLHPFGKVFADTFDAIDI